MPITRATAEKVLVGPDLLSGRLGRRAVMAKLYDLDAGVLGAIPAVGAMLADGLASLGIHPDDPTDPIDDDFALVADADRAQLFDMAELRGLDSILGNLDELDEQVGEDRQDWTKFAEHVRQRAKDLRAWCEGRYGVGTASPSLGVIDLGFAESGDPLDWGFNP